MCFPLQQNYKVFVDFCTNTQWGTEVMAILRLISKVISKLFYSQTTFFFFSLGKINKTKKNNLEKIVFCFSSAFHFIQC